MNQNVDVFLSTGQVFSGRCIGAPLIGSGELVFTTGMVGYSEALSDPSYYGQILTFTYPLIGNYGVPSQSPDSSIPPLGIESLKVAVSGVLITEDFKTPHHRIQTESLDAWLKIHNVPGVSGVDTRYITQIIRENGKMGRQVFAKIVPQKPSGFLARPNLLFNENTFPFENYFDPAQFNLYPEVSNKTPYVIGEGELLINLINFGVKWNIVREFLKRNCRVRILPWDSNYADFMEADAWVLSNGPGNPEKVTEVISKIKELTLTEQPIFGICLGHQLLALALGAKTERLHYGHRSHNQPVRMNGTDRGYITSQNHGFVVIRNSLPDDLVVWFENLNDGSIEGLKHTNKLIRSVQFHPEACGGPHDTSFLIQDFISDVSKKKALCLY